MRTTIAAVIMVKNEAANIPALAANLREHGILAWLVCDTGSTDDTQALVQREFGWADLITEPWVNFGWNRTRLLARARGYADWLLLLDADHRLEGALDLGALDPAVDAYMLSVGDDAFTWRMPYLVSGHKDWRSVGVTHEYLDTLDGQPYRRELLDGITVRHLPKTPEQLQAKLDRDVTLLRAEAEAHPTDARTRFYLAETYKNSGLHTAALMQYQERVRLGGWDEETYYAMFEVGNQLAALGRDNDALGAWIRAWEFRPTRLEALHAAVKHLRTLGHYETAMALVTGAHTPKTPPGDVLFVHTDVWAYLLDFEASIAAYYTDGPHACLWRSEQLLTRDDLPRHIRDAVAHNILQSRRAMGETFEEAL